MQTVKVFMHLEYAAGSDSRAVELPLTRRDQVFFRPTLSTRDLVGRVLPTGGGLQGSMDCVTPNVPAVLGATAGALPTLVLAALQT